MKAADTVNIDKWTGLLSKEARGRYMGLGRNALVESLATEGKPVSSVPLFDVVFGGTRVL